VEFGATIGVKPLEIMSLVSCTEILGRRCRIGGQGTLFQFHAADPYPYRPKDTKLRYLVCILLFVLVIQRGYSITTFIPSIFSIGRDEYIRACLI
jgi:hypothetical protein